MSITSTITRTGIPMHNPPSRRHRAATVPGAARPQRHRGRQWPWRDRQALSALVNERTGVSVELAIRLAKAFGSSPEVWLGMEMAYDLWQARERMAAIEVRRFQAA